MNVYSIQRPCDDEPRRAARPKRASDRSSPHRSASTPKVILMRPEKAHHTSRPHHASIPPATSAAAVTAARLTEIPSAALSSPASPELLVADAVELASATPSSLVAYADMVPVGAASVVAKGDVSARTQRHRRVLTVKAPARRRDRVRGLVEVARVVGHGRKQAYAGRVARGVRQVTEVVRREDAGTSYQSRPIQPAIVDSPLQKRDPQAPAV